MVAGKGTGHRDYRSEYLHYQSQPEQIAKRDSRNKARAAMVKAGKAHKGDGMDVEHRDGNALDDKSNLSNYKMGTKHQNRSYPRTKKAHKVNPTDQVMADTTTDTTTTSPTGLPLDQYQASQVTNPVLPAAATMTPTLAATDDASLQSSGQLMNNNDAGVMMNSATPITAPAVQPTATPVTAAQGTASTVDSSQILNSSNLNTAAQGYTATTIGNNTPQGTAVQGSVNTLATVQGQLNSLYAQTGVGEIPTWAAGAVTAANSVMAARGMGKSTIGGAAITAAVQQSALPIAAQDASTYFQMDMSNLNNAQQMAMQNIQMQQQSMLSDQSAVNAANQFNAQNYSQIQEYVSTLVSNIATQNADRNTAMSQFNAGQANTVGLQNVANQINVDEFTSTQQAAVDQFNASQQFARDQFNSQAAFAIDQSNVTWRRNLNTQNTAAINAANQVNVQNAFNMSQTAQNNLWQQWRDEVSYSFTASQNQTAMNFNAAMAANNQAFAAAQTGFNWANAAGSFAAGLLV